ncbi:MAG: BREX-3 system phosphatase PglZ [Bacteroidetes bacterium]|nr:BREX-3 system phosphatase PglZ [Bacteroidota bacterium]
MSNWIEKYKRLVVSSYKLYVIIADIDNLFDYYELRQSFEDEGYSLYFAKTDLEVRVHFEMAVRESKSKYLIVAPANYLPLPDIEMQVSFHTIGLQQLFPNLDAKAIKGLSYNALCLLSNIKLYEELSQEKTLKFLLENLYNVDFDTLTISKAKERIINALIMVFLEKNDINKPLSDFLVKFSKPYFPILVSTGLTKTNLIAYIQEQWQSYVNQGKSELDFSEATMSRCLGFLFAFDHLKPIQVVPDKYDSFPKQLKIGVYYDKAGQNDNELDGLVEYLTQQLESIEDNADQWFKIIHIFANAKIKSLSTGNIVLQDRYLKVEEQFNHRFQRFIDNVYGSFFSLSGVRKPVVVSRILDHIKADPSHKKALLVVDGMNYWQWNLLGQALNDADLVYSSSASLAFIPTITRWSRQAIFKGDKPDLNEDNLKESKLFQNYWTKAGILPYQIGFQKIDVNEKFDVSGILDDITILGIVCNDLDNIMHGAYLGDDQLITSTQQWIQKSKIVETISALVSRGFRIYITADHGNIEATGLKNLKMKEKVGALSRGMRHLHFTNETLKDSFLNQNVDLDLGKKGQSVYLKNKEAFTTASIKVVTHGGSHFWEVIVPFISINEQ